jgi:hypothetical protein
VMQRPCARSVVNQCDEAMGAPADDGYRGGGAGIKGGHRVPVVDGGAIGDSVVEKK